MSGVYFLLAVDTSGISKQLFTGGGKSVEQEVL
jgi:hypothetical protein